MADFEVEKNVPIQKFWGLPEYVKNLVDLLEVGDSFSFPQEHHLRIKKLTERRHQNGSKRYSIRRAREDGYRIWRVF